MAAHLICVAGRLVVVGVRYEARHDAQQGEGFYLQVRRLPAALSLRRPGGPPNMVPQPGGGARAGGGGHKLATGCSWAPVFVGTSCGVLCGASNGLGASHMIDN